MKILAVESSGNVASVALVDESRLISEYIINHKKTHSQTLLPMIDTLLLNTDTDISEIDLFAASMGPGSFTGLRIGISAIKGLADASRKQVVGINTLDGLAYNLLYSSSNICPIIDARNKQVFTALYNTESGDLKRIGEYKVITLDDLLEEIKLLGKKTVFLGDGVISYGEYILNALGDLCGFAPQNVLLQRASSIASLAKLALDMGDISAPSELLPFYIRKSQPEQLEEINL